MRRLGDEAAARQVDVVASVLGDNAANRVFWTGPSRRLSWADVAGRLETLFELGDAGSLADFVEISLERTNDPVVIVRLAEHPLAVDAAREWIDHAFGDDRSEIADRIAPSAMLGASLAIAAERLLEPERAREVSVWIDARYDRFDPRPQQFRDSLGWRLSDAVTSPTTAARRRLIIGEHFADVEAFLPFLAGAESATLIATSDTFGRADLTRFERWPGIGEIEVEHVRSRTPRFSRGYIDLHEATADAARAIASCLRTVDDLIPDDVLPVLTVGIADFVFFQALKALAIEQLLADDTFDDIVLAVGTRAQSTEFLRLLSLSTGLGDDPRVRVASIANSINERVRFWRILDDLRGGNPSHRPTDVVPADDAVIAGLRRDVDGLARSLRAPEGSPAARVAYISSDNVAFVRSSTGYVETLTAVGLVDVVSCGAGRALLDAVAGLHHVRSVPLAPSGSRFDALGITVRKRIMESLEPRDGDSEAGRATAIAVELCAHRLGRELVGPVLATAEALASWWMHAGERAPDVVVLSPQRTVPVLAAAAAARRSRIPSVALEPHAHDANYSRYVKVLADHYGVMSTYFRDQVRGEFGISDERIHVVGSPLQTQPRDYDRVVRRSDGELLVPSLRDDSRLRLSFFGQPSAWAHVERLWVTILGVASDLDCLVLLKPHPEETASRIEAYRRVAGRMGAAERVVVIDADAETAIALSDLVVTAYSAAAFDATLRRTPVITLTDGDTTYPVDLAAILSVPLARSGAELEQLVSDFAADPGAFQERIDAFLGAEPQFVDGPSERVVSLVQHAMTAGENTVRVPSELPDDLFLDGPHPTFPV